MGIETQKVQDWMHVSAPGRMDAFNFEATKTELEAICLQTSQLALDLTGVHFISIPMIKLVHALALDLARKGGRLALVGATERLKKQFRIFASLEPFTLISVDGWKKIKDTRYNIEARSADLDAF